MQRGQRVSIAAVTVIVTAMALAALPAVAQQVTGTLGSPSATTTISNKQLPPPDPKFGGVIKNDALQSKPWWAPRVVPPKGAPNVLLIITDDAGFGVPSTFGGVIPTPTMDRIAQEGLRYNRMFSTALCSPTRAALITGRNHHSAGFGVISEQSTGFPGYNSIIGKDKATIGRILLDNGYATAWFGKDHNTPAFAASQVGPFDQWPTGMGFEYFYGFVGGDANQWQPNLFRNTTQIYPFEGKAPGTWNLVTAMADDAIDYMTRIHQTDPSKPIFIKYAPGATHAPHHPTREWVDKISAMHLFDDGYEKLRERIFENQKQPGRRSRRDAQLAPWPKDVLKPWDELAPEAKKLFIRQVEVFAAYAAYSDHEIGRVIQHFEELGKLDNTLVIYINGDNGTSAEGGPLGTPNEVAFFNGVNELPVEVQMKFYDVWGTEATYNHMSAGWSWAFDTPVRLVQAERLAPRRHQPEHGGVLAGADQGQGRPARAVRARHRRRADDPRGGRHQGARGRRRHPAGADRGRELRLHLRREERQSGLAAQDAVLRDDGAVRALPRGVVAQHEGQPGAVAGVRSGQPGPAQQPGVPALRPEEGLHPVRGRRREAPAEGQGDAADVRRGGQEVPGLPDGRLGSGADRRAAAEHHRRADRVRLHAGR